MKNRKIVCILLAFAMICVLASCGGSGSGGGGDAKSNLTGTPDEILSKLIEDIGNAGVDMPMSLPPTEVTADVSQNTVGLSEADFNRLVASASSSMAAIGTFAHQIIVIQANDAASAAEVMDLVSGVNGYDSKKWICVYPEKTVAVESGEYVLIAASSGKIVDAALAAFTEAAGNVGEPQTIWESAE